MPSLPAEEISRNLTTYYFAAAETLARNILYQPEMTPRQRHENLCDANALIGEGTTNAIGGTARGSFQAIARRIVDREIGDLEVAAAIADEDITSTARHVLEFARELPAQLFQAFLEFDWLPPQLPSLESLSVEVVSRLFDNTSRMHDLSNGDLGLATTEAFIAASVAARAVVEPPTDRATTMVVVATGFAKIEMAERTIDDYEPLEKKRHDPELQETGLRHRQWARENAVYAAQLLERESPYIIELFEDARDRYNPWVDQIARMTAVRDALAEDSPLRQAWPETGLTIEEEEIASRGVGEQLRGYMPTYSATTPGSVIEPPADHGVVLTSEPEFESPSTSPVQLADERRRDALVEDQEPALPTPDEITGGSSPLSQLDDMREPGGLLLPDDLGSDGPGGTDHPKGPSLDL